MQWLCKEDGTFHEDGPEGIDGCWLNALMDKNITSVEDVEETLEEIIENTGNSSSLNSLESLQKVVKIISKLDNFLKNQSIESSVAENITNGFVQVFSQTIDQSKAWRKGSDKDRVKTTSDVIFSTINSLFV